MNIMAEVWQDLLQILFPAICLNCRSYLETDQRQQALCDKCFGEIELIESRPDLIAVGLYSNAPLRALIHSLKFKHFAHTLPQIETLIRRYIAEEQMPAGQFDLITYIPLHPKRERTRGFNQAKLIAEILGKVMDLPVSPTLVRMRETKEQSSIKNGVERRRNVAGCFTLTDAINLKDKKVVVVDDVYTSGATMAEAVKTLQQSSAEGTPFSLARAGRHILT